MTPTELREQMATVVNGLKSVKAGEIYATHEVRAVLREARKLENRLDRMTRVLWQRRRAAEAAFCEGWPNTPDAPWSLAE